MGTTIKATSSRPFAEPKSPALANREPLSVVAQASHPPSGSLLILHVDVRDGEGVAVKGLDKSDFQVLELPGGVEELSVSLIQDQGASHPNRAGLYTLVFQSWSAPNPGLIAYRIRVQQGARVGVAMTSVMA